MLNFRDHFKTREKQASDFVTDADIASQRAIFDFVKQRYPTHGFLGEEQIADQQSDRGDETYCWIVDPLDGTMNYVHGLQSYSVSVALQMQDRIIAAAVFDPLLDELYSASWNSPATLNEQPIGVSQCRELDQALVVVSLPTGVHRQSEEMESLIRLLEHAQSIRRLGSAALNLCYIAAGKVDAYWTTSTKLWDIAAGWLILERAGGVIRDLSGQPLDPDRPRFAASASAELCSQIERLLSGS